MVETSSRRGPPAFRCLGRCTRRTHVGDRRTGVGRSWLRGDRTVPPRTRESPMSGNTTLASIVCHRTSPAMNRSSPVHRQGIDRAVRRSLRPDGQDSRIFRSGRSRLASYHLGAATGIRRLRPHQDLASFRDRVGTRLVRLHPCSLPTSRKRQGSTRDSATRSVDHLSTTERSNE